MSIFAIDETLDLDGVKGLIFNYVCLVHCKISTQGSYAAVGLVITKKYMLYTHVLAKASNLDPLSLRQLGLLPDC